MKVICDCHAACHIDNRSHYDDPYRDAYADHHHTIAHIHEDGQRHQDKYPVPYNLRQEA